MQSRVIPSRTSVFSRSSLILLMALAIVGCAGPSLDDYRDAGPELVPEEFFRANFLPAAWSRISLAR